MKIIKIVFLFIVILSASKLSYAEESLMNLIKKGSPYGNIRLRYEFIDENGLAKDANASTIRTRLGFKTGQWYHLTGFIEGENVSYLGKDNYNDTVNGKINYPVAADPENTQVNQANLEFTGIPDTAIKGGRQVIVLDGQRFIGDVGWRQNNQVFDAVFISNKSLPDTEVKYGYIYNVNRIFGEQSTVGDWSSNSHFYNISNSSMPIGNIVTYGYFLDFEHDSSMNSNQTFGVALSGQKKLDDVFTLKYYGEYANQSDYGENTTDYNTNYFHIAPALVWKALTATVGYEVLGSDDGVTGFKTPLATLHKWNGWADKFLTTPADGLEDLYFDLTYTVSGLEGPSEFFNGLLIKVQYHNFSSEEGNSDYGSEWGLYFKQPINKNVYIETKYANYNAENFATDTQKLIFDLGFQF